MDDSTRYRLFLAVPVPQSITHILKQQLRLSARLSSGRWVTAGNVHLTIRFLGSVPVVIIPDFWSALLRKLKNTFSAFECVITSISHFPESNPYVIAAMIENSEPLQFLFDVANEVASQFEISSKVTPFRPHITLYRCDKHCQPITPIVLTDCRLPVNELILYRSESSSTGSIYTQLYSLPSEA